MNEQQAMNGSGQGPAGGMEGAGMQQGGMGQGNMGQGGMASGQQQPYPPMAQAYAYGPYPYPAYPQGMTPMPAYGTPNQGTPMGHAPGQGYGAQSGGGQGMAQAIQEMANGGGLSSLTKLLDFDDKDFWKGALVGAAAVLLLTNENVQRALFRGAVKGRDAVEEGVEKVKEGVGKMKLKAQEAKESDHE